MFGSFLSSVVKVVNAPIRAAEDLLGATEEDDRVLSKPADFLAKELKKIDDDE